MVFCKNSYSQSLLAEADIKGNGTYLLAGKDLEVSVHIGAPKARNETNPIGNINSLKGLKITLNGRIISIPKICSQNIADVSSVKLERVGSSFQFWVQGGDGAEAYQVVHAFSSSQPLKCRFLPDADDQSIEPLRSQENSKLIPRMPRGK